jgi:hypothetical protein
VGLPEATHVVLEFGGYEITRWEIPVERRRAFHYGSEFEVSQFVAERLREMFVQLPERSQP